MASASFNKRTPSAVVALVFALGGSATAADHPDLSGIWQIPDAIAQIKTTDGKTPPLNAAAAKIYSERSAQLKRGHKSFDPSVSECKPPAEPRILYTPFPIEIVQAAKQVFFTYQWNKLYRIVNVDQPQTIFAPTYFGTSNATWKGDVLEIDVKGIHDDTLLDDSGMPHSEDLHLIERYQLQDNGQKLAVSIRVEDPKTFTKPWSMRVTLAKLPTDRLGEDVCEERLGFVK